MGERAHRTTDAPSSYSLFAMARPIPLLAPVIMAALFMNINGKVALITGSAKRIGREIALALARRGAEIAVHYRSEERRVGKERRSRDGQDHEKKNGNRHAVISLR